MEWGWQQHAPWKSRMLIKIFVHNFFRQQVMVQSNHFSSELVKMSPDQLDGVLPCVPGGHGMFDLSAEARCGILIYH